MAGIDEIGGISRPVAGQGAAQVLGAIAGSGSSQAGGPQNALEGLQRSQGAQGSQGGGQGCSCGGQCQGGSCGCAACGQQRSQELGLLLVL